MRQRAFQLRLQWRLCFSWLLNRSRGGLSQVWQHLQLDTGKDIQARGTCSWMLLMMMFDDSMIL